MDKYFTYEGTLDKNMAKIVVIKLKIHASFWWDHLQSKRHKRGKEKIKSWVKMIGKMKKSLPSNYQIKLLRKI